MSSSRMETASAEPENEVEKAPTWFLKSLKLFQSETLGHVWVQLLEAWAAFEAANHYEEVGRLSSKGRPDVVDMWIARARSTTWRPAMSDVSEYAQTFTAWWTNLQPEWRVVGGKMQETLLEGDWSVLIHPGLNGIHSVIAALFYWGVEAKKDPKCNRTWAITTENVAAVLQQLRD